MDRPMYLDTCLLDPRTTITNVRGLVTVTPFFRNGNFNRECGAEGYSRRFETSIHTHHFPWWYVISSHVLRLTSYIDQVTPIFGAVVWVFCGFHARSCLQAIPRTNLPSRQRPVYNWQIYNGTAEWTLYGNCWCVRSPIVSYSQRTEPPQLFAGWLSKAISYLYYTICLKIQSRRQATEKRQGRAYVLEEVLGHKYRDIRGRNDTPLTLPLSWRRWVVSHKTDWGRNLCDRLRPKGF